MPRPSQFGDVLRELDSRHGYTRVLAGEAYALAWHVAAGEAIGRFTRAGQVKRGMFEVQVANSALLQELTFQKAALLTKLRQELPQEKIKDLRFKVGKVDGETPR
jgi:predicted nucleic acid-binding Zn ribbon protein